MNKPTTSILALILSAVGALAAGLLTGALAGFLSNIFYIVFLFPLGMGFIGAVFLEKTMAWAKVRAAAHGILLGCLMAGAIYAAFQGANYVFFRWQAASAMNQKLLQETGESEPAVASLFVDYALKEETGFSGFLGYLLYKDKQGVTIGRMFSSGFNLGPIFTWIFWLLELVIIGWVTIGAGRQSTLKPFCENCQRWYGKEKHVGGVHETRSSLLTELLAHQDFLRAGELLEADAQAPSLEIYAQSCGHCDSSDTRLELRRVALDQKGKLTFRLVSRMSIRPQEKADLLLGLRPGAIGTTGIEPEILFAVTK